MKLHLIVLTLFTQVLALAAAEPKLNVLLITADEIRQHYEAGNPYQ